MEGETDVFWSVWGVLALLGQLGNMENRLSNNSLNSPAETPASISLLLHSHVVVL